MPRYHITAIAELMEAGGVVAYPTEAVWGLGCDPLNPSAVERLLHIKQRDWRKGVILLAAEPEMLRHYVNATDAQWQAALEKWPGPFTFVFPASRACPPWIRGGHASVAIRVTDHAGAAALSTAFGGAIVSTSANKAGKPAVRHGWNIGRVGLGVDARMGGVVGSNRTPSRIVDAVSGVVLRD